MSRARMVKRRSKVVQQQRMRRMTRRNHECRVRHWRQMLATMQCTEWMRPINRDVIVAEVYVRCREHRTSAAASVTLSGNEAYRLKRLGLLHHVQYDMLRSAVRTIKRMLIPQRYRREFAA